MFVELLVGIVAYQLIGVALALPLELLFPRVRMNTFDRTRGLRFLFGTALVSACVALMLSEIRRLVHPVISFHSGLGGPVIASIVLALWADLQFYIVHRIEHRFLWRFHRVHHSIRNLSAANSYHHWAEAFWWLPVTLPMMLVNIQIAPLMGALTFIFTYWQFFIHAPTRVNVGPLRWLLVDNRYHRVHHSVQPEHHDKNFGAMTPLWDWLFGTLYMPKSHEWPDVGLKEINEPQSLKEWSTAPWRLRNSEGPNLSSW